MKQTILTVVLACVNVLSIAAAQQPNPSHAASMYTLYELYSWQDSRSGEWNFSVLYNTSREKSVKEVFNKKSILVGLDQVKHKISEMPAGSKIIWLDELVFDGKRQKGSEGLKYPPTEMIQEITRYARSRNIEMFGPFDQGGSLPTLPKQP